MAKYIDKSALVAEIMKMRESYRKCPAHTNYENGLKDGRLIGYEDAIHKINTIEVKEVDLEQEIETFSIELAMKENNGDWLKDITTTAKHFFELGLKAQKDNIRHSMDKTPNYPCDILFVNDVDNMFLFKYMENGRPVDKETPYFHNIQNGKCWYYCNDIMNVY